MFDKSNPIWQPDPSQAWYFNSPSPSDGQSTFWTAVFQPFLQRLGFAKPSDASYGRLKLPLHPYESQLRDKYDVHDRQVLCDSTFSTRTSSTSSPAFVPGSAWICYQIWEKKSSKGEQRADLIYAHGIADYAGAFAPHASRFLDAGYRIIVLDFPAHGRSTGLHGFVPDLNLLSSSLHLVRTDLKAFDEKKNRPVKTFIAGSSMGGYSALAYVLRYGTQTAKLYSADFPIAGLILLCPMLSVSPESRPSYAIELIGKTLRALVPRLPLAAANKGKNSEDMTVEVAFMANPQTYHGLLRIGTGLAILDALTDVAGRFQELDLPLLACHGTGDRVTDHRTTIRLVKEAPSDDKTLKLFESYEHILLRVGKDALDDQRRQNVLDAMMAWLEART